MLDPNKWMQSHVDAYGVVYWDAASLKFVAAEWTNKQDAVKAAAALRENLKQNVMTFESRREYVPVEF